jgi:hypothetical protein
VSQCVIRLIAHGFSRTIGCVLRATWAAREQQRRRLDNALKRGMACSLSLWAGDAGERAMTMRTRRGGRRFVRLTIDGRIDTDRGRDGAWQEVATPPTRGVRSRMLQMVWCVVCVCRRLSRTHLVVRRRESVVAQARRDGTSVIGMMAARKRANTYTTSRRVSAHTRMTSAQVILQPAHGGRAPNGCSEVGGVDSSGRCTWAADTSHMRPDNRGSVSSEPATTCRCTGYEDSHSPPAPPADERNDGGTRRTWLRTDRRPRTDVRTERHERATHASNR